MNFSIGLISLVDNRFQKSLDTSKLEKIVHFRTIDEYISLPINHPMHPAYLRLIHEQVSSVRLQDSSLNISNSTGIPENDFESLVG